MFVWWSSHAMSLPGSTGSTVVWWSSPAMSLPGSTGSTGCTVVWWSSHAMSLPGKTFIGVSIKSTTGRNIINVLLSECVCTLSVRGCVFVSKGGIPLKDDHQMSMLE